MVSDNGHQIDFDLKQDVYQTPDEFSHLPAPALDKMADYYERMATLCRNRAAKLYEFESIQKRANDRFNDLRRFPLLVLRELAKGSENVNTAIENVAKEQNVRFECVKEWYDKYLQGKNAEFQKHRDQAIVQMIGLGLPYQTIASRIGVHPNTITRAVKRELGVVLTGKDKKEIRSSFCPASMRPTNQKQP